MASWSTSSSRNVSIRPEKLLCHLPALALHRSFFERDTHLVSRELLGKLLEGGCGESRVIGRIVETEAYVGADPGSHWHRGETPRCKIVFGTPGLAYVYLIYGNYEMLNFVTEPAGTPGAVLIRAIEPIAGVALMALRRKLSRSDDREIGNGPGKLCRAMGIRMSDQGEPVGGVRIRLFDDGFRPGRILRSPRIGLTRGTEAFSRYLIEGDPHVTQSPMNRRAVPA